MVLLLVWQRTCPLEADVFDKLSSVAVLEHVPDDKQAIAEISRVVKPLGEVFITVPNAYKRIVPIFWLPYYFWDKRIGHLRHYTAEDLTAEFLQCNFSTKETLYTGHMVSCFKHCCHVFFPRFEMKGSTASWKIGGKWI